LRPVEKITQTARLIGARQLSQRIALTGNGDELDRLAHTLNDMLDRIEGHVLRMQQFTADASHELRSPLAALRGGAEVALSRPRSAEELRAVVEESMEHYTRLGRIAEDLLLLARADVGQLPLTRDWIRLDLAVADVVDLYAPLAQDRGIDLRTVEGPEVRMHADGSRIRQLVGNLIDNAVKYGGDHSHVTAAVSQIDDRATIVVADDGTGIAPADLPFLFDRFYRAERSRSSRAAGGAGLGLPICRVIAELHGGDIRIESSPNKGTTVIVTLPLAGDAAT
jgi:heavy metal sensor kinase